MLDTFFIESAPAHAHAHTYQLSLVFLSFMVATFASYTGFGLTENLIHEKNRKYRLYWQSGGAIALGGGIWSMHFVGMLALNMNMETRYDVYLTAFSLGIAIAVAFFALYFLSRSTLTIGQITLAGLLMGFGICSMHYTGMAAMEMDGDVYFIPSLFLMSFGVAFLASTAALYLLFTLSRQTFRYHRLMQVISALIMGAGISGMHYTGMAATVFVPWVNYSYAPQQNHATLAMAVGMVSIGLLLFAHFIEYMVKTNALKNIGDKIYLQFRSIALLLFIFFAYSIIFISTQLTEQKDKVVVINAAGLQRMYIEQYALSISRRRGAHITGVDQTTSALLSPEDTASIIEQNYTAFINGGTITYSADGNLQASIAKPQNQEVTEVMTIAYRKWLYLKQLATSPEFDEAKFNLQWYSTLHTQDHATLLLQRHVEAGFTTLISKQRIIFITTTLLLLATLLYVRYRISNPIEKERRALESHGEMLQKMVNEQTTVLLQEKERAEKAANAKTDFLANMSHELRTPLNSILGMSRLLAKYPLSKKQKELSGMILFSSEYLLTIVNDILDLSKIEAGEIKLESISMDLEYLLETIIAAQTPLAKEKKLTISKEAKSGSLPFVLGDPTRLSQVLNNLISNAIKYTLSGSVKIIYDYQYMNNRNILFKFDVVDTGIGIPQDKLDIVFDKFSQVDISNTRKFGGTGLGLTITRQLINLQGGAIRVKSTVGKGSTFSVSIPFTVTDKKQKAPYKEEQKKREKGKYNHLPPETVRVLIAEDNPMNQMLIRKLMERFDIRHFTLAIDGQRVMEEYHSSEYDLLLLDCHMPQKNGYDVAAEIRTAEQKTKTHIAIVAMTANAMPGDRQKCLNAGMDDYISKPIDEDELKNIMSQWVQFD